MRIIKASWIIPINTPPIKNGYLYIANDGTIIRISDNAPITNHVNLEIYDGIICPGFINTHCHLELSSMKGVIPEGTGLKNFITKMQKNKPPYSLNSLEKIKHADQQMQDSGIIAVGDISNTSNTIKIKKCSPIKYHSFIELFGVNENQTNYILNYGEKIRQEYNDNGLSSSITPHAPYSLSDQLLKQILSNSNGQLLSLHHQEMAFENKLCLKYINSILSFTSKIKFERQSFKDILIQNLLKEQKILLVHNIYSNIKDIEKIESYFSNTYWCTCPKANWYIERRMPNYNLWREKKIKITVGTDSLASNSTLCILEELKLIQQHFPHITTPELLTWACKNGADFFGHEKLGSFKPGNKPGVILIENVKSLQLTKCSKIKLLTK